MSQTTPGSRLLHLNRRTKQRRSKVSIGPDHHHIDRHHAGPEEFNTWDSFWLSSRTICGFSAIFIILATVLVIIRRLDVQQDGFGLITDNHYAYRYGPTAILVLVVAMWRQVDHECKVLTPWQNLRHGRGSAENTVLLDYISPLQIISFCKAVRNHHWAVVVTIASFAILKLVTLASTGVFFVDSVVRSSVTSSLLTATAFNGSLYNATEYLAVADSSLFYNAYAKMAKSLPDSEGISAGLVYEQLAADNSYSTVNSTFSSTVNVFTPSFNCQEAEVSLDLQPEDTLDLYPETQINIISPNCKLLAGKIPVHTLNPRLYACPGRQLSGLMQRVDCTASVPAEGIGNWQLLTLSDIRYNQTVINSSDSDTGGAGFNASSWSTTVAQVNAIVCRPAYKIQRREVFYDYTSEDLKISLGAANVTQENALPGFKNEDLGVMFTSAYTAAALMFGNKADSDVAEEYPDTLFRTMAEISGGTYETLLDKRLMMAAAERTFEHVAAQIFAKNVVQQELNSVAGNTSRAESRLRLRELPFWLMLTGLGLLALFGMILLACRPKRPVPLNPELAGNMAFFLSLSPSFEQVTTGGSLHEEETLRKRLRQYVYSTDFIINLEGQKHFRLVAADGEAHSDNVSGTAEINGGSWWRPLLLRRSLVGLIVALAVALIATPEVLQFVSRRKAGISLASESRGFGTDILMTFVPSLIMLLTSTAFSAIDFNRAALAPYQILKTEKQPPAGSVYQSFLGNMPVVVLWKTFKGCYWNIFLSSIAALFGSLLTIFVSGLFVIDFESMPSTSNLLVQDTFNTTWQNSVSNDSSAAVVSSLIEAANLTYPPFTYNELAFPRLSRSDSLLQVSVSGGLFTTQLPALRGTLFCDTLSADQYNVSESYNARIRTAGVAVEVSATLPEHCPFGGPGGNLSTLDFQYSFQFSNALNASYIGKILDTHVGPYSGPFAGSAGELFPYTQPDNAPGCPSLALIYGYADIEDTTQSIVSVMSCYQIVERIIANVTMDAANLSISDLQPPTVNESSATALVSGQAIRTTSGNASVTAFPFRLQVHMDDALSMFNQTEYSSSSLASQPVVDNFFQAVVFGKTPVPQELLRRSDQESRSRIQQAIQSFYRRYMAQAISANMRVPASPLIAKFTEDQLAAATTKDQEAQPSVIKATLFTKAGVIRVDKTSKIVLQALLGLMASCGLCSLLLSPTEVVRHNPCTISGMATLLSGSRLVKRLATMPFEARVHLLRTSRLRLGWWWDHNRDPEASKDPDGKRGERRYGIDMVD